MANALTLNGGGTCQTSAAIDFSDATTSFEVEIELRIPASLNRGTGNDPSLVSQWSGSAENQNSWWIRIRPDGEIRLRTSVDGTSGNTLAADATAQFSAATTRALKMNVDLTTGNVTFSRADTFGGTYTQIGATVASTITSLRASTAPLEIGGVATHDGFNFRLLGAVKRVRVAKDGVDVVDVNFSLASEGQTAIIDTTGNVWSWGFSGSTAAIWDITDNLGLATPSSDYVARLWADPGESFLIGDVWDYNQAVIEGFIGSRDWLTWDPTPAGWSLGTGGVAAGQYIRLPGDIIMAFGRVSLGTSPTIGTGTTRIIPPVDVDSDFHLSTVGSDIIGQAQSFDAAFNAGRQTGAVFINAVSDLRVVNEEAAGGAFWSDTNPITWATDDEMSLNIIYKGVPE